MTTSAIEQLQTLARRIAREHGISLAQAYRVALKAAPGLYAEALNQQDDARARPGSAFAANYRESVRAVTQEMWAAFPR